MQFTLREDPNRRRHHRQAHLSGHGARTRHRDLVDSGRVIRPARSGEADALTALVVRSKAHWGYDEAFMAAVAADLQFTEEELADSDVLVAERDGAIAGMVAVDDRDARLGWLFVDPAAIGTGVGGALLRAALARAAARGIGALEIDSDPNAEAFYRAHGAERIGTTTRSPTGRQLPRLRIPTGDPQRIERRRDPPHAGP